MTKETAKDRILRVASELFYSEGIRAVGIDRIIAESGVAKSSFYRNFATKDDLVIAFLELRHSRNLSRIDEIKGLYPNEPIKQLYELIKRLSEVILKQDFRGCAYTNTLLEFPDDIHLNHQAALKCRKHHEGLIAQIARESGVKNPETLASQIEMLYSGAYVESRIHKPEVGSENFLNAAKTLIKAHLSNS